MSYLVDTNVLSEARKSRRCDPGVASWFSAVPATEIYVSALTAGEIRKGVEARRRRDELAARALERWLEELMTTYADRILPVDEEVADRWGRLNVPDALPPIDGLLAATASVHGLTLVTRNVRHVERTGVALLNPFSG
ncbi:MAG TPA: type II toxin-antitoxin system VapC family toxin [Thermoanaerobaculia bacterium]|nr:type II toxin-antitoxin system VapC family toxin [Thermoanaerobaculia bacterium]